eukprot:scaffold184740_cov84-Attheya_sp.AAC.1
MVDSNNDVGSASMSNKLKRISDEDCNHLCSLMKNLLTKKLLPLEHMWARHHRLFLFAFGEKATSFVESLNRVIKHGPMPVYANTVLLNGHAV